MSNAAFAISVLICMMVTSCTIGFWDEATRPAEQASITMSSERAQVLHRSCAINQEVQVQVPLCNALAKWAAMQADKAEAEFMAAGL